MIAIEHTWRMRWPFTLGIALLALLATSAWVVRRHDSARTAYERIATQFEEPFLPVGFDGDMMGANRDLPDGRREIEWAEGWRSVGPVVSGLDSGTWEIIAPDGSIRARFEMRGGERDGPCEFRDARGLCRVRGAYRRSQRCGIWTLENVLGQGSAHLYFGP
jgi:hypothetical protein